MDKRTSVEDNDNGGKSLVFPSPKFKSSTEIYDLMKASLGKLEKLVSKLIDIMGV